MTTEIATVGPSSGALALRSDQHEWNTDQRAALAQIGVDKASPGDLAVFMHVAQRTGLDPFSRQLYMINRSGKWTIQTGIDGFRVIADRRPEYGGQLGPQWCGDDGQWREFWPAGKPVAARVGVVRRDWDQPAWGVALYNEFVVANNHMWKDKPAHMLAKCAEALAIRKAFPHDLAGLYTDDEMGRADGRPGRVVHQSTAVTVDELTGAGAAPAATPEPPAAVAGGDHMSQQQQGRLFALLRDSEIEDRWDWASGVLGRDITSYGQLSAADASRLITVLEQSGSGAEPAS